MPTFKTLDDIFNAAASQVTAQQILNGRIHLKSIPSSKFSGWSEIQITPELREEVISRVVESAGGREKTKMRMYSRMRYDRPQHWAIDRFLLQKYGDKPAFLSYCAGQDQTYEMKQLREYLK